MGSAYHRANWLSLRLLRRISIIPLKMKNTKTTLAGVGAILVAVGGALKAIFDGDPSTNVDLTTTIAAVTAGIGLIWAKDATEVPQIKKPE
jgi:hypothetical protein